MENYDGFHKYSGGYDWYELEDGIIFRGRSLGIDKDPTQDDKAVTTEAVHAASVFFVVYRVWLSSHKSSEKG